MALTQIKTSAIADDAVTQAKMADDSIGADQMAAAAIQLGNNALSTNCIVNANLGNGIVDNDAIAEDTIGESKLDISNNPTDGQFLKYKDDTDKLTWDDVPAGVGGATGVDFNDNVKARFGTGNDLEIFHNESDSIINDAGTGNLKLQLGGATKAEVVTGGVTVTGNLEPEADNTRNLGSSSKRWANVYVGDIELSNEGSKNDVDGSWGKWTIQEGEDHLFLINRRSGKKFRFLLRPVTEDKHEST